MLAGKTAINSAMIPQAARPGCFGHEQQDAQENVATPADINKLPVQRQVGRHDLNVELGHDEVHRARDDHESCQEDF